MPFAGPESRKKAERERRRGGSSCERKRKDLKERRGEGDPCSFALVWMRGGKRKGKGGKPPQKLTPNDQETHETRISPTPSVEGWRREKGGGGGKIKKKKEG